ncbi:MAG: hypothetical protein ACOCXJ_00415 [Planctomycetota bacterium]
MAILHVLVLPLVMALAWGWTAMRLTQGSDPGGLLVLLGGVLLVYGGDRLRDPAPVLAALWLRAAWQRRLLVGLTGLGPPVVLLGLWWSWWPALVTLGCAALLVGLWLPARRLPGAAELVVASAWALVCACLPTGLPPWVAVQALGPWIVLQLLLFTAGTILCGLKDRVHDRARGHRSLADLDDGGAAQRVAMALALSAGMLAWQLPFRGPVSVAGALLLLAQFPTVLRRPLLGPILVDTALCLVLVDPPSP